MADVSLTLTLPDQPALGTVRFMPLGGDGFTAPHSAYLVGRVQLIGDAAGGTATITINLDPRYESQVSQVLVQADSVAAATDFSLTLGTEDNLYIDRIRFSADNKVAGDLTNSGSWSPAPFLKARSLVMVTDNIDTEKYYLDALVYNFNIEATQKLPLSLLLASLPRASSLIV